MIARTQARGVGPSVSCRRPLRKWIASQLALLTLPVEIQVMLSTGEVSERDGRSLARRLKEDPDQDSAQLLAHLTSAKEAAEQQKAEEQRLLAAGREALAQAGSSDLLSADNKPASSPEPSADTAPESLSRLIEPSRRRSVSTNPVVAGRRAEGLRPPRGPPSQRS
ncbi:hypothetical protein ACWCXX_35605 [Streptomyces sp. NPDC001732]